jgi:hypothetical protein
MLWKSHWRCSFYISTEFCIGKYLLLLLVVVVVVVAAAVALPQPPQVWK